MSMSPYAAAGMLEVAHQLGLLPSMAETTRHAIMAGLVGYGLGQPSDSGQAEFEAARARERAERFRYLRELEAQVHTENAQRQREYDERLHAVLLNAALAHNAR